MIANKFNMVDMKGVDVLLSNGQAFSGLYQKLNSALVYYQYATLYNWRCNRVSLTPQICQLSRKPNNVIVINDRFEVYPNDIFRVVIDSAVVQSLSVAENGTYVAPAGIDGYTPVNVNVPPPVLQAKSITENGIYMPEEGVDGFSSVNVNVPDSLLTPAYCHQVPPYLSSVGDYYRGNGANCYLTFYDLAPGTYGLFLSPSTLYGRRYRISFFEGKSFATDFESSLEEVSSSYLLYNATTYISGDTSLNGPDNATRFIFTISASGVLVCYTGINLDLPVYLVKIS